MGELAKKAVEGRRDQPATKSLNANERKALTILRREAKENGAVLANNGEGGLPPTMVLGAFRRAGYRCEQADDDDAACQDSDGRGTKKNGLTVHHRGGIVDSKKADEMGHRTTQENLEILCEGDHDKDHEEARDQGIDSSQVTPEGDE